MLSPNFQFRNGWVSFESNWCPAFHYSDVVMGSMESQITSLTTVYSTVYSGADERKHQSSASLAFVRGIHRWPQGPVTRKKVFIWLRHHVSVNFGGIYFVATDSTQILSLWVNAWGVCRYHDMKGVGCLSPKSLLVNSLCAWLFDIKIFHECGFNACTRRRIFGFYMSYKWTILDLVTNKNHTIQYSEYY